MDSLRRWALWVAVAAILLAVLACVGAGVVVSPPPLGERIAALAQPGASLPEGVDAGDVAAIAEDGAFGAEAEDPPGLGIPFLALPLALTLLMVGIMALPLLIGHRAGALVNGIASLVGGLGAAVAGVLLALLAFAALTTMVALFLAAPFGTLAYLAVFGFFDVGASAAILGAALVLQLAAVAFLIVAQPRMLGSKRMVFFLLLVLLLTLLTMVLHSVVPGIVVSIADALAALITAVVGAVWGFLVLIGGVVAVLKQLSLGRQGGGALRERDAGTATVPTAGA
ncbi:hypothetical protein ASD19_12245 [Microbacterium sp. Root53]|uniref:hypothetical protein n=1 Tax=Microbacterium sp. Root53 TaxID=1736553 RepID=UPI0006F98C12|nr:hypothetical protein [Microbacterium sp. Root53]KQZ07219.1 hypothetical protein ASD19_12245 [Microbacterium sp. Root53]